MKHEYHQINSIAANGPNTLQVTWRKGETSVIDLTGVIARVKAFAPLKDPKVFMRAGVIDNGIAIGWPGNLDLGCDTLWRYAEEQTTITGLNE